MRISSAPENQNFPRAPQRHTENVMRTHQYSIVIHPVRAVELFVALRAQPLRYLVLFELNIALHALRHREQGNSMFEYKADGGIY